MTEVRNIGAGVFVGGDAAAPPAPSVESFNGRTGAVVSEAGDYLAAVRFGAALEAVDFAAVAGTVHRIDATLVDPPITMTLPAAPVDKAVVGFVFEGAPVSVDAALNIDANGSTIAGVIPSTSVPARQPNAPILFVWSAAAATWQVENWTDFILSLAGDAPKVMVARDVSAGRNLFPVTMGTDSVLVRAGSADVQAMQLGDPSIFANFGAKPYTSQDGLGGYSRETFSEQLNTLLPWFPGDIAGDTTALVNRAYRIAPPAGTLVTITLPTHLDLVGGEQVLLYRKNRSSGALRVHAGASAFDIPGLGILSTPPDTYYSPAPNAAVVLFQYDFDSGCWVAQSPSFDPWMVAEGNVNALINAGVTVDLPGPPSADFVRVYDNVQAFVQTAGTLGLMPVAIFDGVNTWNLVGPVPTGSVGTITTTSAIGFGEVLRVQNTGANDNQLAATYVDYPAANVSLVRMNLSAVAQDVIPAPPAGFFRRWFRRTPRNNIDVSFIAGGVVVVNRDSVAASYLWRMNAGTLYARGSANAGAQAQPIQPVQQLAVTAATGAMTLELTAAPTTTAPTLIGAYETLPLTIT